MIYLLAVVVVLGLVAWIFFGRKEDAAAEHEQPPPVHRFRSGAFNGLRYHALSVQNDSWGNDDRIFVDEALGLFAVARAKGPTYGGYHRPINVDRGLKKVASILKQRSATLSTLREALNDANRMLPITQKHLLEDGRRHRQGGLKHAGWTFTGAVIANDRLDIAHIGVCRAYLWRYPYLSKLTTEHNRVSAAQKITEKSNPMENQTSFLETVYLGSGTPDVEARAIERVEQKLEAGDVLLLVSPGVWGFVADTFISHVIEKHPKDPGAICDALVRHTAYLDASAIVVVKT